MTPVHSYQMFFNKFAFFPFKKIMVQLFLRNSVRFSIVLASIPRYMSCDTTKNNEKKLCMSSETCILHRNRVFNITIANTHNSTTFPGNHNHLLQFFTASVNEMLFQNINGLFLAELQTAKNRRENTLL